jgi:DNA-binding transcriptional LysR family regulator
LPTGINTELLAALKAGELDLVVGRMAEPDAMQGLSFALLYAEPLALVVRPEHPLLALPGASASLQAVLDYPLVIATPGTVPRHHTEALFQTHGLRLPTGVTETLSVSVARLLACRSNAVWVTPERAARDDLQRGGLVRLDIATSATKEPVGLLHRSASVPSELASAFMEMLTDLAQAP